MQDSQILSDKPVKSLNIFGQPMMIFDVPVDQKTIFTNHKGVYKKNVEKRQRKLIVKSTFVKSFLKTNERIFYLTTGYSPITVLEQVLTGLAFLYFKRTFFIFTEKRLLHVPVRRSAKTEPSISQILYDDCKQITLKGRSLVVQYKDGRQDTFPYIGRKEKKKVRALLASIPFQPKAPAPAQSRRYLCPACTQLLAENDPACPTCQLKFKSRLPAMVMAAAIPGGGYFYSGYSLLGIFFALLELMLFGFIAYQWINIPNGLPGGNGLLALLAAGLLLEKTMVTYHAGLLVEGFLATKKNISRHKTERPDQDSETTS